MLHDTAAAAARDTVSHREPQDALDSATRLLGRVARELNVHPSSAIILSSKDQEDLRVAQRHVSAALTRVGRIAATRPIAHA